MKSADVFKTNDLQFGFKPQSSTAKCICALMETVCYFQHNKSYVFVQLWNRPPSPLRAVTGVKSEGIFFCLSDLSAERKLKDYSI